MLKSRYELFSQPGGEQGKVSAACWLRQWRLDENSEPGGVISIGDRINSNHRSKFVEVWRQWGKRRTGQNASFGLPP